MTGFPRLGGSTGNQAGRTFRIEAYPNSTSRPANWRDDTIYVCLCNEGFFDSVDNPTGVNQAEPSQKGYGFGKYIRKYVISSLAGLHLLPDQVTYPGSFYIDVAGMPWAGAQYHIVAFRHFNDGTATQMWNEAFYDMRAINAATRATRLELDHLTTWVEDWSYGIRDCTTDGFPLYPYWFEQHTGDPTVGNYLSITGASQALRSRRTWRHDQPWTIKAKFRQRKSVSNPNYNFMALGVMEGEAEYVTVQFAATATGLFQYTNEVGTSSVVTPGSPAAYSAGASWRQLELRGDGAGHTSIYCDGVLQATITTPFTGPLSFWLGNVGVAGNVVDIGPVTVTGTFDVWSVSDTSANKEFTTSSDFGTQRGNEWSTVGSGNFFSNAGGVTKRTVDGGLVGNEWTAGDDTWATGTFQANTPPLFLAPGQSYSQLKLAGNTQGHGTLIAYVRRYDGTLVPDSEIPGNSAGFTANGTADTVISLAGVTTDGIYVDLQGNNTSAGTTKPPVWQRVTVEFNYNAAAAAMQDFPLVRDLGFLAESQETDVAQSVRPVRIRHVGEPSETDTALPVHGLKGKTVGEAVETDLAQAIARIKGKVLGEATEADLAQPVTRVKSRPTGDALEADSARSVRPAKADTVGEPAESDAAPPVDASKGRVVGVAAETDRGLPLVHDPHGFATTEEQLAASVENTTEQASKGTTENG